MTALVVAAAAGCATGPVFVAPEPPGQTFAAVVYIYRSRALPGSGTKHVIHVDARQAVLRNGGYLRFEVHAPAPTHSNPIGPRPAGTPVERQAWLTRVVSPDCGLQDVALPLTMGQIAYVQLELVNRSFELGGKHYFDYGCRLVHRDEAQAMADLQGLRQSAP